MDLMSIWELSNNIILPAGGSKPFKAELLPSQRNWFLMMGLREQVRRKANYKFPITWPQPQLTTILLSIITGVQYNNVARPQG